MVALESNSLFRHLDPERLARLRAVSRELSFAAGQQIFKAGDPGDGLYVVQTGVVTISANLSTGERRVFARVMPAEMFGEMAVVDDQPRSAEAAAEVETTVCFVPRDPMLELLRDSPDLALRLTREISGRLRDFNRVYLREVLQAERMAVVGRFASSIVHDLKNPLSIITMGADLACAETVSPDKRKLARDRIVKQIERITELVNDILDFTRGTNTDVVLLTADYGAFVEGLVAELQPEVLLKDVTIELETPPPPIKLPLHPQRLRRVFHNLVNNAVDAMAQGGKVTLRFEVTEFEVTTEIRDTGPGIPDEIADRLFQPFTTHGKARGTGLGLSICQRVIQEHGGKISARNLPSGGAAFTFTLPRAGRPVAKPHGPPSDSARNAP